jgi:hypothetical protein
LKSFVVGMVVAASAIGAQAADERSAVAVVKKYSETVACQIVEKEFQRNQYKAVKVLAADKEMDGLGDLFVVYWEGDFGCSGGNGTIRPNFTVVEQRGFASADPVVVTDEAFPQLELARLTSMSAKNGMLQISGVAYGPKDDQGVPNKKVNYALKYDLEKGAWVKR